jgi:Flp pilus assembly pilin Flp
MFAYCFALLERVKADRRGVTALEYGMIAGAVVAVLGIAFTNFYNALKDTLVNVATGL